MTDIAGVQMDLEDALEEAEQWLTSLGALSADSGIAVDALAAALKRVEALRARASSVLMNVALLGAFSSGKSFLLSGLQGGLQLEIVGNARKYIGLLPSDTRPTSTCPATVEPVAQRQAVEGRDCSGRGFLRVRFSGSWSWEDIGPSPTPATVASYASSLRTNTHSGRLDGHRNREVDEIQLLVSSFTLQAKLYDLPGHGSTNKAHDAIVRARMQDADCFLYVATSTRTLDDSDLSLIRFLYDHHKQTGKKVIWVVTAIDKAADLGLDDKPAWQATVEENERFLADNFRLPDGRPDAGFIGSGFMAVSPALEARGQLALDPDGGHYDPAAGAALVGESHMEDLRERLRKVIEQDSGRKHLQQIVEEARAVVRPHSRALVRALEAERAPHNALKGNLSALTTLQQELNSAIEGLSSELERMLQRRIHAADLAFDRSPTLASHLHDVLDDQIRQGDIRKPAVDNEIEVRKIQEMRGWMTEPAGPATRWDMQFDAFKTDVLRLLDQHLRDEVMAGDLGQLRSLDVADLIVPRDAKERHSHARDVLKRITAVTGAAGAMGGAATSLGLASGGTLLPVGAAILGGMALFEAVHYRKTRGSSLDLQRQELIGHLDNAAQGARERFQATAAAVGSDVIANALGILTERRNELSQQITRIRQRLSAQENLDRQTRISQLEPVSQRGVSIVRTLTALAR
ncbi:dynamin family protein [Streptomyces natalensis]|uniref:Dynamin N-terminal domain-containing protein n=1 Tax=Streptomyces natalensis ATCC 27448 TaxID=1240678 RepID=A0A0D7CBL1_9ACTN|nr:dynamin family protein [Streptomyces natalensis]KIZ13674.1 hypothetical protein SNA_37330 [Streptomyces natalensis ATCC 27448]